MMKDEPDFEIRKVKLEDYVKFTEKYFNSPKKEHQRLGQAFMNQFEGDVWDDDLYYCKSTQIAMRIIYEKYLDFGEE